MSRFYQSLDAPRFEYDLQAYPGLDGLEFRGPRVDIDARPIVCLGAAQTFGRFVDAPFPRLLADALGVPVLNLAVGGVGPRHYLQPHYSPYLRAARLVVVQVLSGSNASNSLVTDAHETLHRCGAMLATRRDDGRRTTNREVLHEVLAAGGPSAVRRVVAETRADFVTATIELLSCTPVPTVLLWFSIRRPRYRERWDDIDRLMSAHPHLLDARCVRTMRGAATAFVPVVSRRGLPEPLWRASAPVQGAELRDGQIENHHYPSAAMHRLAARRLSPVCRRLLRE
ncbi:MAG: hypothetical protein IPM29_09780 [Planctomycetes bacterium]|nr:hypothetical protein [Planctomycetota bacterium]